MPARRSLETEQEHLLDAPLLNARPALTHEADAIATRALNAPETQMGQTASVATRNPNAILELPPTEQQLAVKAQVSAAIAKRKREQQRQRVLTQLFNGDGGPYQWHGDVFETFSYALASGMAMGDALRQASQNAPPELQIVFADIAAQIEHGVPLTQALKAHQEELPDVVVPIFEHGLIYGTAENAARQTARALQKLAQVETKFEYSAINPGFIIPLVVAGVMILALVPIAFLCANPLVPYTLFCAFMLSAGALAWKFRYKLAARKRKNLTRSKKALNARGSGFARRQIGGARWSRTFVALWNCGVPVSAALEAAGRSTRNAHYEKILCDAAQSARNGVSLGDSLARVGLVKGEMLNAVLTGETAGDLASVLERLADVLEDDAKERSGQIVFLAFFGTLFLGALLVCILAVTFALVYKAHPISFD